MTKREKEFMNITLWRMAKKYIKWGQEFLTQEYGSYEGKTTGMDVDEDTNDEWYRDSLKKQILKDKTVSQCWWVNETYGHTLWLKF